MINTYGASANYITGQTNDLSPAVVRLSSFKEDFVRPAGNQLEPGPFADRQCQFRSPVARLPAVA